MFGFLIVSFAIWGIGDIFRGSARTTVARSARPRSPSTQFRTAYQNELQRLDAPARAASITPEQARALGLDPQVLSRARDRGRARPSGRKNCGLAVSDSAIARTDHARPELPRRQRPVRPRRLRRNPALERPQRSRVRARAARRRSCACSSPSHRGRRLPCRSRCARRSTATATSAARRLTSCCRRRPPATSRRRPRSSCKPFSTSTRRLSARPNSGSVNALVVEPETLAEPEQDLRRRCPAALRAGQGAALRDAGAADHPADRLPERRGGRDRRKRDQGRRELRGHRGRAQRRSRRVSNSARSPGTNMHRSGRGERRLRARRGRRQRTGAGRASARCSCASQRSSPRASSPSRRSRPT